jgi:DNA polymerase-4
VLAQWVPVVVVASVDEWYVDASGTEALYPEPFAATMRRLRAAVEAATGITLSIGCATNRLVAKMAADAGAKPSKGGEGVFEVPPDGEAAFSALATSRRSPA